MRSIDSMWDDLDEDSEKRSKEKENRAKEMLNKTDRVLHESLIKRLEEETDPKKRAAIKEKLNSL